MHCTEDDVSSHLFTLCLSPDQMIFIFSSFCSRGQGTAGLEAFTARLISCWTNHGLTLKTLIDPSYHPPGSKRDARREADCQAPAVALLVTVQHPPGASGAGPQREPARGAGAKDHSHRDYGDRGGVRGMELALHDLPGPLVLLQLLHPVPQQVHPVVAGGGAQHAG